MWLRVAESLAAVATPTLIAIGGFFAWYKFIRQGEHDSRLQGTVTAEITIQDGTAYIIARVGVQNTGQVDVTLDLEQSGLLVLARNAGQGWRSLDIVYGVFTGQEKAQPNETLEDQIWIEFDVEETVAVCLELAIAEAGGQTWRATEIVSLLNSGNSSSGG